MITEYTTISTDDKDLRASLFIAHSGRCFYSGRDINLPDMHVDHINPRANGGLDQIANYVPCVQEINLAKNDAHDGRFIEVVSEINRLVYAKKVVSVYNERRFNPDSEITLFDYFNSNKKLNKLSAVEKAALRQKIRKSGVQSISRGGHKNRKWLLYLKCDLDEFIQGCQT